MAVTHIFPETKTLDHSLSWKGSIEPASYFAWKDVVGRCLALAILIPALPIMLIFMGLVKLSSPGPAIYRQRRVGKHGRVYDILKIRSMRIDAENGTGAVWSVEKDPRVTLIGRVIRALHIDEFPQLFNVLKGEMSLIGPRPERPEFVKRLALDIPGYLDRLSVRPGITGLAQLNLPPDSDLESVCRKVRLDIEYIQNGSAGLDTRIFLCTFFRLFGIKSSLSVKIFKIHRNPDLLPVLEHSAPAPHISAQKHPSSNGTRLYAPSNHTHELQSSSSE